MGGYSATPSPSLVPLPLPTGAKARDFSPTALESTAETDSPLEEERFEPSVPRDTTKFSMPAHVTYAWFPARGKVGANESRHHDDAGRLPRNRLFESGVLQRRDGMGQAARRWHSSLANN